MKKLKKGFTLIEFLVIIAIIGILCAIVLSFSRPSKANACGWFSDCTKNELQTTLDTQKKLVSAIPIPQLETSQERINVSKRAEIFSKADKISYIYLISYGKVMAFYTVKGKVSSLRSYMAPLEKIVSSRGNDCNDVGGCENGYVVAAPDIDGTYGENVEGIFFFTTEDAYVEYHGDYMMSDQPLKLSTTPELVRTIK